MNGTLENVLQIVSATSDQSFDDLAELMKPKSHTREEMQEIYDETLGYDPTTYFDKRDVEKIVDRIAIDPATPAEALDYIKDQREDIVESAFDQFDSERETFLQASVEQVIEEATGVGIDADIPEDDFGDPDYDESEEDDEDDFDDDSY